MDLHENNWILKKGMAKWRERDGKGRDGKENKTVYAMI